MTIDPVAMTDTRQVLEDAFAKVFPPPPNAHLGMDIPALEAHTQIARRFRRFLDAEAWMDAAMCLVPEGWEWAYLDNAAIVREAGTLKHAYGNAPIPALAIAQACLKARENGDG